MQSLRKFSLRVVDVYKRQPIHSDEKNNKITYASMFGVERASEMVSEMSDEAVEILKSMNANTDFLVKLTNYLIKRDS